MVLTNTWLGASRKQSNRLRNYFGVSQCATSASKCGGTWNTSPPRSACGNAAAGAARKGVRKGDVIDVQIDSLGFGGVGVARLSSDSSTNWDDEDMIVYTPKGVLPGDKVRVKAKKVRRRAKSIDDSSAQRAMSALERAARGHSYIEAAIVERTDRSPRAIPSRCQHFGLHKFGGGGCGGCVHMDLSYEDQLEQKQRQVEQIFSDLGTLCPDIDRIVPCDEVFEYRNKMEFSYGRKWMKDGTRIKKSPMARSGSTTSMLREGELSKATLSRRASEGLDYALGLHASGRYDRVVEISECHVQDSTANRILQHVRERCEHMGLAPYDAVDHSGYVRNVAIRKSVNTAGSPEYMVNIMTNPCFAPDLLVPLAAGLREKFPDITCVVQNMPSKLSDTAMDYSQQRLLAGDRDYIEQRVGDLIFEISAGSFFQTNTAQAEVLYSLVRDAAKLTSRDTVLDLFCGTGTIGLSMASSCKKVVGVEMVEDALSNAKRSAVRNGVKNAEFLLGDLTKLRELKPYMLSKMEADVIIVDPPRAGLHKNLVKYLSTANMRRIVYVSCNPMSQVQDIKSLLERAPNRFVVQKVVPVDMFPHTPHIETVCSIAIRGPGDS